MDQAMAQLLANQLGLSAQNGSMQPSDLVAALASQTQDPLMASLLTQMANRKPAAEVEDSGADDPDYEREMLRLKKVIIRLKQGLASADVMAHFIADIFGACPTCWGLNQLCPHCHGKGKPGYADPNMEELRAWVEPALKKGGLHIAQAQPQ